MRSDSASGRSSCASASATGWQVPSTGICSTSTRNSATSSRSRRFSSTWRPWRLSPSAKRKQRPEAIGAERRQVAARRRNGDEVGDEPRGHGRKREPLHRVPGREHEAGNAGWGADHGQPVGSARPQPAPHLEDSAARLIAEEPRRGAPDRLDPHLTDAEVEAYKLERTGEAEAAIERRHGHRRPRLLQQDGYARVGASRLEVDVVALATLEWDEDAQRAGEARSPGAGGEDDDRRTKLAFRSLDRD